MPRSFLLTVGIASQPAYLPWLRALLPAVNRVAAGGRLSKAAQWRSTVALVEAVTNAMTHAHRRDPRQMIWITCAVRRGTVRLAIADRGPPFRLPRRVTAPQPTRLRGRGCYLMQTLMHGVRVRRRDGHNIVELMYHGGLASPPRSAKPSGSPPHRRCAAGISHDTRP